VLGSVCFTGDILAATDRLELLCHQSKTRSRGVVQYQLKDIFLRNTLFCSWCNNYVTQLVCQWFSVRLSSCRLSFFFLCFFSGST